MKSNKRKSKTRAELKAQNKKRYPKQKNTGVYPRKLARSVAKETMRRSGWRKINKHMAADWVHIIKSKEG